MGKNERKNMEIPKNMIVFVGTIKNVILFLSLWIVSYFIVDIFSDSWDSFVILFQSLALTIIIIFVWKKISKRYL